MVQTMDYKGKNTGKIKSAGTSPPVDFKQIFPVISALNLIKMNIGMYPAGHIRIDESVERAYSLIQHYFQGRSEMIIGVADKTLLLNEVVLDKKSNACREYARALNVFRVITLSLKRTVTREDLIQFSRILSSKPSDVWTMGKLEEVLARSSVNGIQVRTIDADYFRLTDEKETRKKMRDEDFWLEFISHLAFHASRTEVKNPVADTLADSDLQETIRTLNDERQHWQKAIASYENMIQQYFYEIRTGRQVNAGIYEALAKVADLFRDFHPDLKEQLLGVVERQLSLQPETVLVMENMKCFTREMLLEIVHLADKRQSQVSPSLMMLLQKMSAIEDGGKSHQQVDGQNLTSSEMEELLKREEHEKYIPEKYDQLLKKLSKAASTADDVAEDVFPLSAYLNILDDEHIDFRICELVFALMDEETDEERYLVYSNRLAPFIPDLLKKGKFSFLTSVTATLRRHGQENPSEKIRRRALSVLYTLTDSDSIAGYTTPFILKGTETAMVAKFLVMSGVQNIPWLFDLYLDPAMTVCDTLMDIIKGFGKNAVDEASKRLSRQTPLAVIRLLALFREMDNHSTIPLLKELYEYDDWNVKKEVLEILFLFKEAGAVDLLRKSLHSSNREEVLQAVNLTFLYEVRELMGELMSLLKTFYIPEEDAILNEWIARRLGNTGHPWAVSYIENIMATRFTLSPQRLSRMKEILSESLDQFPRQTVQSLLTRGSKSWNRRIRENCLKIMGQKES